MKQDFPSGGSQYPRGSWSIRESLGYYDNSVLKKTISTWIKYFFLLKNAVW